ncbi:MAG: hypothetical protein RI544_06860 [Haloquadratum sp.]|nr:hypothetical protein [Haloquadratum sp.]
MAEYAVIRIRRDTKDKIEEMKPQGVLGVTDDPLVSSDIQGMPYSSLVDLASTNRVGAGAMYKVLTWYDNEFGFSNRMLDMAQFITA